MKANCWYGKQDVRVETVPEPTILNKRDVILKVTSTAMRVRSSSVQWADPNDEGRRHPRARIHGRSG